MRKIKEVLRLRFELGPKGQRRRAERRSQVQDDLPARLPSTERHSGTDGLASVVRN